MENGTTIIASLKFDQKEIEVGELVWYDKGIFFKYYPDFISLGIEISPLKMSL